MATVLRETVNLIHPKRSFRALTDGPAATGSCGWDDCRMAVMAACLRSSEKNSAMVVEVHLKVEVRCRYCGFDERRCRRVRP